MHTYFRKAESISFKKALILSLICHFLLIAISAFFTRKPPEDKKVYTAIQVAVIGNYKDLPSVTKKDAHRAVPVSKGKQDGTLKLSKSRGKTNKSAKKSSTGGIGNKIKTDELILSKKGPDRSSIIGRLKRIHSLKKRLKNASGNSIKDSSDGKSSSSTGKGSSGEAKGSPDGVPGIEGTTVAQAGGKGIQNLYILKAQRKISAHFFVPPGFEGDSPELKTIILIKINEDGDLKHIEILESSGNEIYDDQAYAAVKNSAPFGPVPEEFKKLFEEVGFGLRFKRSDFD